MRPSSRSLLRLTGLIIHLSCAYGFPVGDKRPNHAYSASVTTAASHSSTVLTPRFASTLPAAAAAAAAAITESPPVTNVVELIQLVPSSVLRVPQADMPRGLQHTWMQLVPNILEQSRGIDQRVQWSSSSSSSSSISRRSSISSISDTTAISAAAARLVDLMQHELPWMTTIRPKNADQMERHVAASMQLFQDFCTRHLRPTSTTTTADRIHDCGCDFTFQVRVVATRGPDGTKCPVWHTDHVPVRWIQSLVGPGCEWVEDSRNGDGVPPEQGNNDNDDDDYVDFVVQSPQERNRQLVDSTAATIHQAAQGQAVLLIGSRWAELVALDLDDSATIPLPIAPAVHKSPDQLLPWQGRVLLTMDVLYD